MEYKVVSISNSRNEFCILNVDEVYGESILGVLNEIKEENKEMILSGCDCECDKKNGLEEFEEFWSLVKVVEEEDFGFIECGEEGFCVVLGEKNKWFEENIEDLSEEKYNEFNEYVNK